MTTESSPDIKESDPTCCNWLSYLFSGSSSTRHAEKNLKDQEVQTEKVITMNDDELQAFCGNIAKISGDWYNKLCKPQ
jgi:hypothetical protein